MRVLWYLRGSVPHRHPVPASDRTGAGHRAAGRAAAEAARRGQLAGRDPDRPPADAGIRLQARCAGDGQRFCGCD